MEVVLSPGRFGDEASGGPFQNEEIREWSHVDRLTGMLERARVETGRWQASIQGAAKSYGKVIDSRERNSADGSVVQRARRQVEVFQSQGPGRSVQVVRASQWSSSRVTDSILNGPQTLNSIAQKEEKPSDHFTDLCRLNPPISSPIRRDEAISERLSSLLGSFTYPVSSTVPLRRIDSKYASRTPISLTTSKRCSSNENVSLRDENFTDLKTTSKLLRESKNQRIELYPNKKDFSSHSETEEIPKIRVHAINVECEDRQQIAAPEINEVTNEKNSFEETRPATITTATKAAIHLLPSSKANTTVVNLINSGHNQSWPEAKNPEIIMSGPTGRVKRVGFCKTEIHFAADSGKVNIVETDGKPPPTNKFRRRKRNLSGNKISPITNIINANYNETLGNIVARSDERTEEKKKENDPNLHRGHTTTVNLGNDFAINDERNERVFPDEQQQQQQQRHDNSGSFEASSQRILLRLENRIYDRLESCTSEDHRSETASMKNNQLSSLKSARLVLNITRQPIATGVSKILIDNKANNSSIENNLPIKIEDDERKTIKRYEEINDDTRNYLDWEADNEVKSIMLGTSSLDNQEFDKFSEEDTLEMENIEENIGAIHIGEETSQVVESLDTEVNSCSSIPVLIPTESLPKPERAEDYNVLCTDAENNQVLLKVVTTHEPTIARVENDHLRKKTIVANNLPPAVAKKERRINTKPVKSENPNKEHTYVNIFTCSKRVPIYENYKISDFDQKFKSKINSSTTNEAKIVKEKIRSDGKNQNSVGTSKSKELENSKIDGIKTVVEDNTPTVSNVEDIPNVNKHNHSRTKETKLPVKSKLTRPEVASTNSTTSGTSRVRSSSNNNSKIFTTKKSSIRSQDESISSGERSLRISGRSINGNSTNVGKSTRDVVASVKAIKKNDGSTKNKPMEVVYQTAVYNMKNERLSKPHKGKESKGPRYLNELICGAKTKRSSESKNKSSSTTNNSIDKGATQKVRHWK